MPKFEVKLIPFNSDKKDELTVNIIADGAVQAAHIAQEQNKGYWAISSDIIDND